MTEILRTRDVVAIYKGDAYAVMIDPAMRQQGWAGGQGVMWANCPNDDLMVGFSDGVYGGFMLWGSNESSDQYTAMTGQFIAYGYTVLAAGGWLISTATYEKYTYASRMGGGPLVPITYTVGERLVFSNRGLFTNQDEWSLSGDPRAPNMYYIANVIAAPSLESNWHITLQTSI
jgi:hypothetical protein